MKCGLLGRKLGHSYSPAIHALLGDYEYDLYEVEPENLEDFLRNGDFDGLNVTIPYKQTVIPHLDELTSVAKELGAVNTILRKNGKLIGTNTDYFGFHSMIAKSGLSPAGKKCLVLGSGGASKVVQTVLQEYGADVIVISRTGENSYHNIAIHSDAAILVNATPVGMYPNTGTSPVDLDLFPNLEGVLDLIYNPARTKLLMDAENRSIVAMNGLWMLAAQAKCAAEYFTGMPIPGDITGQIHADIKRRSENIILIGMPGCGKSTVGKLLAAKTGKLFVDADAEIEKMAKKTIPRIFAEDGEPVFRNWETQVMEKLGKESGLVIATGGGCVTMERNYPLLHQNGRIFWLQRDVENLATDGRPLSQNIDLKEMYESRKAMYQRFSDHEIDNNGDVHAAVTEIITKWRCCI
ncbi:MAG: shikimate kinase [Ruminococcaceae bacterium]|nr:shikimate kinase [Oscillospiraceae bacterium]